MGMLLKAFHNLQRQRQGPAPVLTANEGFFPFPNAAEKSPQLHCKGVFLLQLWVLTDHKLSSGEERRLSGGT